MKLLVLGGGFNQLNAIKKAKSKGHTIIVSDYLPDAPGKKIADYSELVSTFDIEGNIEVAKKYKVDRVFTIGTDQPVLTAAKVAETLGLPHHISADTALKVTNKQYMKEVFLNNHIPSAKYLLINKLELEDSPLLIKKLSALKFPIVVKPLDSQGQRGIYKLEENNERLINYFQDTFNYTNLDTIIVEEFFAGDEITVSLWVEDFTPYILAITDRPLLNVLPHLGTPDGHIFPSKYLFSHYEKIYILIENIIKAFVIPRGPLYIQLKVNGDNIEVIEIACRIGGGHEDELIPLLTGIDIVDMLIDSVANNIDVNILKNYNLLKNDKYAMVKFLIAGAGKVGSMGDLTEVLNLEGVVNASFYNPNLKEVKELVDSTCRVGYLLVTGHDMPNLLSNVKKAYDEVKIYDEVSENMIYHRKKLD